MKKSIEIKWVNKRPNIDRINAILREYRANPHGIDEINAKKRIENTQSN